MIRDRALEREVLAMVGLAPEAATSEIARSVNRCGTSASRAAVRKALRALLDDGQVKNVGETVDQWKLNREC